MTTAHSLLLMQSIQERKFFDGIWNTFPSICIHLDRICDIINLFFLPFFHIASSFCFCSKHIVQRVIHQFPRTFLMTNSSCGVII